MSTYHWNEDANEVATLAKQAEALADEMQGAISTLVTHEQMQAAMDRLTIRLGLMVAGIVTLACTIMGVILSK